MKAIDIIYNLYTYFFIVIILWILGGLVIFRWIDSAKPQNIFVSKYNNTEKKWVIAWPFGIQWKKYVPPEEQHYFLEYRKRKKIGYIYMGALIFLILLTNNVLKTL